MKPFSLLIKPASADCNLRCKYCFYIDHLNNIKPRPRMSEDVLENLIASYMKTDQKNHFIFGWQGGEPTLMGMNFFKKVVELQIKYAPQGANISNGLQTNGTLITNEMAQFFGEYKFLVGVSLDGPAYFHDYYRKTIDQKPSHSLVMRGIERLRKSNVEFNILTLINNINVKKGKEIYKYLRENGFFFHQYIPCVEFNEDNKLLPYSITGKDWGRFLCDVFDEWIKEDINKISIRLFDSLLDYLVNKRYNVCHLGINCCQYFVVEYDGNVYPCDFFVRDDLLLGNILNNSWEELLNSPKYIQFGKQKSHWNKICLSCPYLDLCNGDCQKFRPGIIQGKESLSVLCEGWKMFYTYSLPFFKTIANKLKEGKKLTNLSSINIKKTGRNEPCPCGSGKKYKNCCMR